MVHRTAFVTLSAGLRNRIAGKRPGDKFACGSHDIKGDPQ
ncbi:hypothetical protein SP19_139 [Salmonella phage 19]|nr:hypothetical protein SP19_139 [Salmonella phage 19]